MSKEKLLKHLSISQGLVGWLMFTDGVNYFIINKILGGILLCFVSAIWFSMAYASFKDYKKEKTANSIC